MLDLNQIWFILLIVLLTGYAILDGFDLGVGIIYPLIGDDTHKRVLLNSIGPVWDGNEVWLVTLGGALFAAFPHVYATAFSGLYTPFMLLLFALILRATSIEFRSKQKHVIWRNFWDTAFFLGSSLASFLFGVCIGNLLEGMPIHSDMELRTSFIALLKPYPIMCGLFTLSACAMHGTIYLLFKTKDKLKKQIDRFTWHTFGFFLCFYLMVTIFTLINIPTAIINLKVMPLAWVVIFINIIAVVNIPRSLFLKNYLEAFVSSSFTFMALATLFGLAMYPNLITSSIDPAYNLTIYNCASSVKTLNIMLIIAIIGMPCVLAYTTIIYYVFRGKVELDSTSY